MQKKQLINGHISLLRSQKGGICITMIIPFDREQPAANNIVMHKLAQRAREVLDSNYKSYEAGPLHGKIDELIADVNPEAGAEGIGLYISSSVNLCVYFPFAVRERLLISDRFELRELMYKEDYGSPYLVMVLNGQQARLFSGTCNILTEINDTAFPMRYVDEYSYSKPAAASSFSGSARVVSFEKDKSEMKTIRLRGFFRQVDKALGAYLSGSPGLILLAVQEELPLFRTITAHKGNIIAEFEGDYGKAGEKQLAEIAWPLMRSHLEQRRIMMLRELEVQYYAGKSIPGVSEIWLAAHQGKGFRLLVEKDYHRAGFLNDTEEQLYLHPPKNMRKILTDAVEDCIETVLNKNGEVYFVENGSLQEYDHIAMITHD